MNTLCEEKLRLPSNIVGRMLRSERGISLVVVIMLMVIILAITGAGLLFSSIDLRVSGNYKAGTQAFYVADAGASAGFQQIVRSTVTSTLPFNGTVNGMTYCSGTIATTGANCAAPQPLPAPIAKPADQSSLAGGAMYNSDRTGYYIYQYQIDATGVGPLGSTRQVQALATYGPVN
jgi:Tfp pilus assembly protein PilX